MVATLLEPVTAVVIAGLLPSEQLTLGSALGSLLFVAAIAGIGRTAGTPEPH